MRGKNKPNLFLFIILILFFQLNITSAVTLTNLGTFQENQNVRITQVCSDATWINITSISYPNSTNAISNVAMIKEGGEFYYDFSNTSRLGRYDVRGISDGCENTFATYFDITSNGEILNIQTAMIQMIIIVFFIVLILLFYITQSKFNYELWYKGIIKKYQNRNYVKFVLASMVYNLMKNSFIIYYLLGLPIIVTLVDLSYSYNLVNLLSILRVVLILYSVGILIVGLFFISYVQEWFVDLLDKVSDEDWGIVP